MVFVFPDGRCIAEGNIPLKLDIEVNPGWHYACWEIGSKFIKDIL